MAQQQHGPRAGTPRRAALASLRGPRNLLDPWRDAFVLHLRRAWVDGRAVGDALAQVDSHCAESGQDPQEAFGNAAPYAADIAAALDPARHTCRPARWQAGVLGGGGMLGVAGLLGGVDGLAHHRPATIGLGLAVCAVVVPLVAMGVISLLAWTTRTGRVDRFFWFGPVAGGGACALPAVALQRPIASLPAVAAVVTGLLVLVAARLLCLVLPRRTRPDLVIDPRTGHVRFQVPGRVNPLTWSVPAILVAAAVLATALGR
jgi:hypothetical protein